MLKGDLATTPLPEVLRRLADGGATGCLHVLDAAGEKAQVYLRGGRVYAVLAPGNRPAMGSRLVSSGALGPEALAEALEAQRTELQGWRLGELLVHLGYVDQPVVEDFVNEQVRASLSDLLPWQHATWRFRVNERTREDVAPPVAVAVLLDEIEARQDLWAQMEQVLHGPDAVPMLSAGDTASGETEIDTDAWSLLCKVDGVRSVAELARECGFTLYEAGRVVYRLVVDGLLEVEEAEVAESADAVAAEAAVESAVEPEPAGEAQPLAPRAVAARLASALSGLGVPSQREAESRAVPHPVDDATVTGSISRVSEGLSALLGPATASDDVFGAPVRRPAPTVASVQPEDPKRAERDRRAAARRDRDAAELADAQAELEAAKAAHEAQFEAEHGEDHVADVVDLFSVRAAAEALAEAEESRQVEELRAAELAERVREEEERLAAEAAAATEAAAAAAEQTRLDAEAAEQARLDAEAAEQARVAEQQRLDAEAAEQQRQHEEAETARLQEEERLAAEAARLAEQVEAARVQEEQRLAEEQRLIAAAAEQARLDAEAAEQARVAEQQRHDAEAAEQQRLHEEAEAARVQEAERLAAETAEQERLAEEQEAAEHARVVAELRLEQELHAAEQQRLAEQEADRRAQEAAAAAEFAALTADLEPEAEARYAHDEHDAQTQAAAFAELSASAASVVAPPPPAAPPAPVDALSDDDLPAYAPAFSFGHDTDTASLLRELSSLGLDDDAPPPPVTRPAAARPVSMTPAKKRKGLFGRG